MPEKQRAPATGIAGDAAIQGISETANKYPIAPSDASARAGSRAAALFAWLNGVFANPAVSPTGFKLAYRLGQYFDRRTGEAWPTQQTLAAAMNVSDRTIRTELNALVQAGHLEIRAGRGPRNPNRYSMSENRKPASVLNRKPTSAIDGLNEEAGFLIPDQQTGNLASENRKPASKQTGSPLPTEPLKGTIEEPSGLRPDALSASVVEVLAPVYTDAKHKLWGEGPPILVSLGVSDRQARQMIGRWLRDMREDADAVLSAIRRARDERVIEPIAWITRALKPRFPTSHHGSHAQPSSGHRGPANADAVVAGMARVAARLVADRGGQ